MPIEDTSDTIVEESVIIPNPTITATDTGQVLGESTETKDEENPNKNWIIGLVSILILILIIIIFRRKII